MGLEIYKVKYTAIGSISYCGADLFDKYHNADTGMYCLQTDDKLKLINDINNSDWDTKSKEYLLKVVEKLEEEEDFQIM